MPNDDSTPKPWEEVEGNDRARGGTPIGQGCPIQPVTCNQITHAFLSTCHWGSRVVWNSWPWGGRIGPGEGIVCPLIATPSEWVDAVAASVATLSILPPTHNNRKVPFCFLTFFFRLYTLLGGHAKDCAETVIMPIDDCVSRGVRHGGPTLWHCTGTGAMMFQGEFGKNRAGVIKRKNRGRALTRIR